ncbi:MAG: carboxylating nicotinate-nucleotide diphosphorylase [Alphaproteobacteria bacterium]|nr:MAG: carboxylating nicotinate-nucleotide diphosphorylase [Alphaproteobacteria bacterium]
MTQNISALPLVLITPIIERALQEDLGIGGDLTTLATIHEDAVSAAVLVARQEGVIAGLDLAEETFRAVDPRLTFKRLVKDGDDVANGTKVAHVSGPARGLLTGERVALNFLGRMSGIATLTRYYVRALEDLPTQIACTRKTTPTLRALEKQAVRLGGGVNHRYALDDAILIKDNHIAMNGSLSGAVRSAKAFAGHMTKVEVEVDTLDQLREVMDIGVDAVLLDNMDPETLKEAVKIVAGRAITEASGGINLSTARAIAETGVDMISIGALTHSAPNFDIAMDFSG